MHRFCIVFLLCCLNAVFARSYKVESNSVESYEVDETDLVKYNISLLSLLHPEASELLNGSLFRGRRCCCCDCCCCGSSSGSEEGVAIGDMLALASLVQSNQAQAQTQQASNRNDALAGLLPYPLAPRSLDSPRPSEADRRPDNDNNNKQQLFEEKSTPGGICNIDEDCVTGATCVAHKFIGLRLCQCQQPLVALDGACVQPSV